MDITKTPLSGLLIIKPKVFEDLRGFFFESYNKKILSDNGINVDFVQDNHSFSGKNTLRGLHFQSKPGQAKLVRVINGVIWDVVVDIRKDSPTFGKWHSQELSHQNKLMLFIPIGFAHGFCTPNESAEVLYKTSNFYNNETEKGIAWNDKDLSIDWPIKNPTISQRDKNNLSFKDYINEIQK